jgi:hypothetical protein
MPNVLSAAIPRAIPAGFRGACIDLGPHDIEDAAADIAVPEAHYRGLLIVETGAREAFPGGRPAILYEAHIARRLCGADVPGLSVPKWDRTLYGRTLAAEYDRLDRAIHHLAIGRDVALKAASWGLPQILGVNHALCGYGDVESFVAAMCHSAADQLQALNRFLTARGIVEPLRNGDLPTVARLYNGTAYRENRYDEKLAIAIGRARRGAGDGVLGIGDVGPDVATIQRALVRKGISVLVDGDYGRRRLEPVRQPGQCAGHSRHRPRR